MRHSYERIERLLDLALEATFPASDPVSISSAVAAAMPERRIDTLKTRHAPTVASHRRSS
jgi:hypothetical protein